jgi:hypothetical protein
MAEDGMTFDESYSASNSTKKEGYDGTRVENERLQMEPWKYELLQRDTPDKKQAF